MNKEEIKKLRFLRIPIAFMILLVVLVIVSFIEDESLRIKNKQTTVGIVDDIIDEGRIYNHFISFEKQYSVLRNPYIATIIIKYEVNGREYYKEKQVKSYYSFKSTNPDYSIGNKIKIVYNTENPNESAVNELEIYEITIWIIAIIEILILINILHKKYKNKSCNILLKTIKIDSIDYERERIFFEDKNNDLYYYETDFGEEFLINEQYDIKLRHNNKKTNKIQYEDKWVNAMQIINIEMKEFVKKIY